MQEHAENAAPKASQSFVVLSGKGGVGKSSVAAGLAVLLASRGLRVGLLDCDLHGPSLSAMFGLTGHRAGVTANEKLVPAPAGPTGLSLMSIQFVLDTPDTAVVWRGPLKHKFIRQMIDTTDWGEPDVLIADCPPGTGDEPLSVVQTLKPTGAVVVTTPQEVSSFDVRKSLRFCSTLDVPVAGVVENMAGFHCPHCGTVTHVFGSGGGRSLAEQYQVPLLASLPLDPSMVAMGDEGRMGELAGLDSPVVSGLRDVTEKLAADVAAR